MTRRNQLQMDGREIKLRLIAERSKNNSGLVHVDWLRFTKPLAAAPVRTLNELFGPDVVWTMERPYSLHELDEIKEMRLRLYRTLQTMPDGEYSASAQALELARKVAKNLGPDFSVYPELRKGVDFYKYRWLIVRNGVECGWVGFLASGDSPRQKAQDSTLHVNVSGSACTYAADGWRFRMADLIEKSGAKITRVDLALDFFDGINPLEEECGMHRVRADYEAGKMDVQGKRPAVDMHGPWTVGDKSGKGRTFYFGSREAGKQTCCYEKGKQLFGPKDATGWERVELRYGDKLRVIPVDVLIRPDDFFAGASDWHKAILAEAGAVATAAPIRCKPKLSVESVKAEVTRAVRWLTDTASPSLALAFKHLAESDFLELVTNKKMPGRLQRFSELEIASACAALSPTVFKPRARFAH